MAGWMGGWVGGWMDEWIAKQIDGLIDRWIDSWIDHSKTVIIMQKYMITTILLLSEGTNEW